MTVVCAPRQEPPANPAAPPEPAAPVRRRWLGELPDVLRLVALVDLEEAAGSRLGSGGAQRTKSLTCAYTVAFSCSVEWVMQEVCVLVAPDSATLLSGLITSSQGDHQVR